MRGPASPCRALRLATEPHCIASLCCSLWRVAIETTLQVRRGGKGRLQWEVVVSDRGPRHSLPPYWIPQLQLHMAACGCHSGLLVSRCVAHLRAAAVYRAGARCSVLLQQ